MTVLAQHEVLYVVRRDQHALASGPTPSATELEESLDFFVDGADRLHVAVLIDRTGHGQRLQGGVSDKLDNRAQVSASDALSPSMTP